MKSVKQIREEYDNRFLDQAHIAPDELMLEGQHDTGIIKKSPRTIPSSSEMPSMLLFRRITYRLYPDKQVIALYYSKTLNKYLSIPFGPDGNLNLSESSVYDTIEELDLNEDAKWEALKGGVKGAAHGAVRGLFKGNAVAAEPGMAIGAVVGGVHGAYKGAKSAYKKAKEQEMEEDWQDVNRKDRTSGLSQKAVNAYRREHPGSKLQTAVTEKNPTGKRASRRKSFCARMGGMKKRLTSAKTAHDPDSNINKALRRWNCEESFKTKLHEKRQERLEENPLIAGALRAAGGWALGKLGSAAGAAVKALTGAGDSKTAAADSTDSAVTKAPRGHKFTSNRPKSYSSFEAGRPSSSSFESRLRAATEKEIKAIHENKISDIRSMIENEKSLHEMNINGRVITLNTGMAKRILEVYDSVNTKNKKIVESMLNEDLESFKKLLNFSIKA